MNNYVAVILAVIAVILVAEFVVEFADWNKEQACVSSGRRNCGGPGLLLNHGRQGVFQWQARPRSWTSGFAP